MLSQEFNSSVRQEGGFNNWAKRFELNFLLLHKKKNFLLMVKKVGKIISTTIKFKQCPQISETSGYSLWY